MHDLTPPHGGLAEPVSLTVPADEVERFRAEAARLPEVPVSDADLSSVYRFGDGGLSPLTGPMDEATYHRVLDEGAIEHGGRLHALPQPKHPEFGKYVLAPREVRRLLAAKGWTRVVAFQTRNPLHRAHEYALVYGLETLLRAGHDAGAVLNPLLGETKGDDVHADVRMRTYEALIQTRALGEGDSDPTLWGPRGESVPDRVILLGLDIKMFYGGPKEAVMHAIYRQNFEIGRASCRERV